MDGSWFRRATAGLALAAVVLPACGTDTPAPPTPSVVASTPAPTASALDLGPGVTAEPCPDAADAARGCIYLGALSDVSEGPYAALGASILRGTQAFWRRVDAEGGIDGRYDTDVETYARDTRFDPQAHAAAAAEIEPSVLAIAMSLGAEQTLAALALVTTPDLLVVPGSLWSGWAFEPRTVPSGYSYCVESVGALDWYTTERGAVTTVMSVHHGDLYGRDSQEGVRRWAEANGVAFDVALHGLVTPRTTTEVGQDDAVATIVATDPDVVVLATGPVEAAEIVTKTRAEGSEARFLGSVPTWNPALLESRAGDALRSNYEVALPWLPWGGDSDAHRAMGASLLEEVPSNEGFVFGWMTQYPLLAALEAAARDGASPDRGRLVSALDGLEVTFEGGAPTRTYGRDNEIQRRVAIATPADDEPLGTVVTAEAYLGPTAETIEIDAPCSSL